MRAKAAVSHLISHITHAQFLNRNQLIIRANDVIYSAGLGPTMKLIPIERFHILIIGIVMVSFGEPNFSERLREVKDVEIKIAMRLI